MEPISEIINLIDDGIIPNSKYPVIIYHHAFTMEDQPAADFLELRFAENGWSNAFRWKVYDFHHYHTNTHEVLGVYAGNALLQLGGPEGEKLHVRPGDVIILPAGTSHIALSHSDDFMVVGAYPHGVEPDLIKLDDQRPEGVIARVDGIAIPKRDPFFGNSEQGLIESWNERESRIV